MVLRVLLVVCLLAAACTGDDGDHCGVPCGIQASPGLDLVVAPRADLADAIVTVTFDGREAASPVPIPENGFNDESVLLWNVEVRASPSDDDPDVSVVWAVIDYRDVRNSSDTYVMSVTRADGSVVSYSWLATYTRYMGCRHSCVSGVLEER
jgi:hypothetical protein